MTLQEVLRTPCVRAYLECALWAETLPPYGDCPDCGQTAVLSRWDEDGAHVCDDCSEREPNYEPPADANYGLEDLAPSALESAAADCERFLRSLPEDSEGCQEAYMDEDRAGHDLWLTRNGHGAGFWDGDWPEPAGEQLTAAAHKMGEVNVYVSDDGRLYFARG